MVRTGEFMLSEKEKEQLLHLSFEFDVKKTEWMNLYYWAVYVKIMKRSLAIDPLETALQPLREWIAHQKGTLFEDKIALLEKIGFCPFLSQKECAGKNAL
jgi:hypothetical protein